MFQRVPHRLARKTVVRAIPIQITLMHRDSALIGRAKPGSRFDERVEHHLEVESRAADDLEHVGGGCLLLKGLAQLVEQPCVLDGDDGLCGKVFCQLDLLVCERSNFLTVDNHRADWFVVLKQWNAEHRPSTGESSE